MAPHSSENQPLKINSSVLPGMKSTPIVAVISDCPAFCLAAIANSRPHMAIPAKVMAHGVTKTGLLRTI